MTYTILPNSGQSLGVTRAPINTNFSLIQSVLATNHVTFNNTGAGKHTLIQIPSVQAASPGTLAGEIALYTKNVSGIPQLFLQTQSQAAAGPDIQLTANITPGVFVATYTPLPTGATGSVVTFVAGNMFIASGFILGVNGSQQVTFPFNLSVVYSVQLTRLATEGAPPSNRSFHQVTALSTTPGGFTFRSLNDGGAQTAGYNVYWTMMATL